MSDENTEWETTWIAHTHLEQPWTIIFLEGVGEKQHQYAIRAALEDLGNNLLGSLQWRFQILLSLKYSPRDTIIYVD